MDKDLAEMYGIDTKVLKQAVKRNAERFPDDFIFILTQKEFQHLRSQFVTSSWGGIRYLPTAFTEQGVAMLSGVLNSPVAVQVAYSDNIQRQTQLLQLALECPICHSLLLRNSTAIQLTRHLLVEA